MIGHLLNSLRAPAALLGLALVTGACGVYTLGGPGHGKDFVVPPGALTSPDPVVKSWAAYSLARSTCQLSRDAERPSHFDSFECELRPREVLVERWRTRSADENPDSAGARYLARLVEVDDAGFLAEYVWFHLRRSGWNRADFLRLEAFEPWRKRHLAGHRPQTRIIGWWTDDAARAGGS